MFCFVMTEKVIKTSVLLNCMDADFVKINMNAKQGYFSAIFFIMLVHAAAMFQHILWKKISTIIIENIK